MHQGGAQEWLVALTVADFNQNSAQPIFLAAFHNGMAIDSAPRWNVVHNTGVTGEYFQCIANGKFFDFVLRFDDGHRA